MMHVASHANMHECARDVRYDANGGKKDAAGFARSKFAEHGRIRHGALSVRRVVWLGDHCLVFSNRAALRHRVAMNGGGVGGWGVNRPS